MITYIAIASAIGLLACIIYLFKPTKPSSNHRRGVYHSELHWSVLDYLGGPRTKHTTKLAIMVEEIDRIADQSKINILDIDFKDAVNDVHRNWVIKEIKNNLGEWINTSDVKWESPKELEMKKIIETPLDKLAKQIEADDIESI